MTRARHAATIGVRARRPRLVTRLSAWASSPRIEEHKRDHIYDYAERTTRYVLMDLDAERVRSEVARSANRERDRWF